MLTYFKGSGGLGVVIDGCIRDYPHAQTLGLGLWLRGVTPNFHTQTNIGGPPLCRECIHGLWGYATLVMPGDIIVADDDGVVVVPIDLVPELLVKASEHAEWEEFSRMKLAQGGDLRKYYPLTEEAQAEYDAWRAEQEK